jgi:NTP pyrophosphatase (non-canonical NTP hydrolase)
MTEIPTADETALDRVRAFAKTLGPAQRVIHEHKRRFGLYDNVDAVEQMSPQARPFTVAARLMHIVSELAEAFEEVRNPATSLDRTPRPSDDALAGELADAVLHLMDLAEDLGVDLGNTITAKLDQGDRYAMRPHRRL